LARICAVPIIIWLILNSRMTAAFWLVLAAALSDAADGAIAKHFNQTTELGAYLDPIADKTLLVCTFIAMGYQGYIPEWLVIAVVFRDFVIIGGALSFHVMTQSLIMEPIKISKVNTVAQLVLAVEILASEGLGFEFGVFRDVMIILVAVTTVVSGAVYVVVWSRKAIADEVARSGHEEE
jgi:cardiolipin synthase (CMP-forming)